jgi:5'-methylthioadenosine phosphorylase
LAKELGLCYASVATITDYDCWKHQDDHSPVHLQMVLENLKKGAQNVLQLFKAVVPAIAAQDWSETLRDNEVRSTS